MSAESAALARSITRNSSKLSYIIARLLADRDLTDDCLRAYAYFRWADDMIDVSARTAEERLLFINRQRELIDRLYRGERPDHLAPEEEMIADLIARDRGQNSGLQSFIRYFAEVLAFDARRKGQLISQAELTGYSHCLGQAVTEAIQYFVGFDQEYPDSHDRYRSATAAHITHMLRDMAEDLSEGFINIPQEWLIDYWVVGQVHRPEDRRFDLAILDDPAFKTWVKGQVDLARAHFQAGKRYLDELEHLRCQVAAYWYCARFECVLDAIERDGYTLRREYHERRKLLTKLKMAWCAISLTWRHVGRRSRRGQRRPDAPPLDAGYERPATEH